MAIRIIRWLVQFRGQPDVGYHSSIGKDLSKICARWTAQNYGGRLVCEFSDGSVEVKGDWTRHFPEEAGEPVANLA